MQVLVILSELSWHSVAGGLLWESCAVALLAVIISIWGNRDTRDSLQGEKKQSHSSNSLPQRQLGTPQYLHRASRATSPISSTKHKARKAKATGRHTEDEAEAPGINKKPIQQQKQQLSSPRSGITSSLASPVHLYPICKTSYFLTAVFVITVLDFLQSFWEVCIYPLRIFINWGCSVLE